MSAYGAEVILVSHEEGGMLLARDVAEQMVAEGKGVMLDQFANDDNWRAHYKTTGPEISTGPEIWRDTKSQVTHFVSSMGTTGTIVGNSTYLKEQNPNVQIVGVQPEDGSQIPGIRRWRQMAIQEGICAGVSSGGAMAVAIELAKELDDKKETATIVSIVCDRGDRYLSTGVYK